MNSTVLPRAVPELLPVPAEAHPVVCSIAGVGTAVPESSYSQQEVLDLYQVTDPRIRSVFLNSAIDRRHLTLAAPGPDGRPADESQGALLRKQARQGVVLGAAALDACLADSGHTYADIGYLCCVTSTGMLTPGLTALLITELGLSTEVSRLDVVGMGCNAGLNALNAVTGWSLAHPGRLAVMLCVEVCSAAYVFDGSMRTSVVNGLFGDGAAGVTLVSMPAATAAPGPRVLRFASHIIADSLGAMRYDWDEQSGKYSFFLDRDVPYVVGAAAADVIGRLLRGTGLRRSDIAHWLIHSGGRKVIDSVRVNLGLTRHDVRHTTAVLREYGNVSSGSFLFSLQRLKREGVARPGEYGLLMTMGPGSTIETALIRF
ncbi:3,5-dihydroxyphenylacetyl-CoA synthase DpgA [Streptomyces fuscichromogenes]